MVQIGSMSRTILTAAACAALVTAFLGGVPSSSASAPDAGRQVPADAADKGSPGKWSKISTGTGSITFEASLVRTADGVLHVVYPKDAGSGDGQIGHTAISASGATLRQNDVLPSPWSIVESTPIIIGNTGGGLRVVFGGQQTSSPGYWSEGRMYTLSAPAAGDSWTLPAEAVGTSSAAYASYGTGATSLEDGTPVAAFPLNSDIVWHVGTGTGPDSSFTVASCCAYDLTLVRDGNAVYVGWYANGGSAETNGTFVRQILPTLGPIQKAPGSSNGTDSVGTGRVALAARAGGGVVAAYCTGYPNCDAIMLWDVGTGKTAKVKNTKYASRVALGPGPSGRLWLAWGNNIPVVQATRTGKTGLKTGPARNVGLPTGTAALYTVAVDGTGGTGDLVVNVGDGFWHTQVVPGLSIKAKPAKWEHGKKKKVTFTVTDAGDRMAGVKIKVGGRKCTTATNGKCSITFPATQKMGRLTAKATHRGFAPAKTKLKVT